MTEAIAVPGPPRRPNPVHYAGVAASSVGESRGSLLPKRRFVAHPGFNTDLTPKASIAPRMPKSKAIRLEIRLLPRVAPKRALPRPCAFARRFRFARALRM